MENEVIVVGAGPVGLMLAGELRLGGVDVVVFERRTTPSGESRGLGFTARATELFGQRGLLARFGDVETGRQGHFGGIPMDFGVLDGSHFGTRGIPQYRIERMLAEWVRELGVRVLRGHEVVDLRTGEDGVVAVVDGPTGRYEHSAEYLVACDGGRGPMRHLAGFEFPGTEATRECYLADVVGRRIRPRFIGERVAGGMVMSAPLEDGVDRIIVCENGRKPTGDGREVTFDEVADAWQRLTGESLHGADIRWVSAFTDTTRQVTQYRRGRVLIAGDAAHVHLPAGGQGLSLGVQDAVNLGWKLAATVRGWAPEGLLDSYHDERHPVGARVLRNTLAQGTLYLSGAEIEPLRSVVAELVAIPAVGRHLSGMVSGLDIRYAVGGTDHPLLGMRMPDRELPRLDGGPVRTTELLHPARGVFVCRGGEIDGAGGLARGWSDRIDVVPVRWTPSDANGTEFESVLIRPDGYVAWAAPGGGDLRTALGRWFGAPQLAHAAARQ
jgi:bifunctional hydroxylase/dehydrase